MSETDLLDNGKLDPCKYTHDQLLSGACPWCGTRLGDAGSMSWSVSKLKAHIMGFDRGTVFGTLINVRRFVASDPAIQVLDLALASQHNDVRSFATSVALVRGLGSDIAQLQTYFEGYHAAGRVASALFFLGGSQVPQFQSEEIRALRAIIVQGLIDLQPKLDVLARPESALPIFLYGSEVDVAQRRWNRQIERFPGDEVVLKNHVRWMQYSGVVV